MSSIAVSNTRFVHFNDEPSKPPSDRSRIDGLVYPRVAQIKGEANSRKSFDLCWKFDCLSAASRVSSVGIVEAEHVTPRIPVSRSPRISFAQRISENLTTPKLLSSPNLPSTPLSNIFYHDNPVLRARPSLCSSRFSGDSSSLDGSSAYSYSTSNSGSSSDSDL
ncbi:hypothetical protein BDP27DRAFT_879318 [Rhodocollybia butyracea]|uniref:Uncharacterized protein n=1 Tax=Rhodocollybia butyracea TaxID=206335 RepID=A0A9P5Q7H4_9AGAR|nr:hypothetical protein BDP27DRAFT_879318 [Rhodocollybia butyracea]